MNEGKPCLYILAENSSHVQPVGILGYEELSLGFKNFNFDIDLFFVNSGFTVLAFSCHSFIVAFLYCFFILAFLVKVKTIFL